MMMKNPPHPGQSLLDNCIAPLGMSITGTARHLGVSRKHLSNIVNGNAGISAEMAIRLEKAFGSTAECWCRIQLAYDIAQAKKKAKQIKVKRIDYDPETIVLMD